MKYSSLVDRVKGDAADVWDSHYSAQADQNRGEDVIVLSVGDPDFATPDAITEAAVVALRSGDTHYTPVVGIEAFRENIAKRLVKTRAPTMSLLHQALKTRCSLPLCASQRKMTKS
jgi:aspartate/methionine/tyrosine aminotransferase